jgi:hypothetical protein
MDDAEYLVVFSNLTGCAAGISEISWSTRVRAASEAAALRCAIALATRQNEEAGLPPHGLRVSPAYLESLACICRLQ